MTIFNDNSSKENLQQRINTAVKRVELRNINPLKLLLKPDRLHPPRKRRAGFTLTETLLVIIVVISVLAGLLALYNGVQNHLRNAALQSQIIRAVGIIERAHSYSGTYGGESLVGFLNGEGFSANEVYKVGSNYVFISPYETPITIVGGGDTAPDSRHFTMVLADLPPAACKLAALAFRDSGSGLDDLNINEGEAIGLNPLDESKVNTQCNANPDRNKVSLKF